MPQELLTVPNFKIEIAGKKLSVEMMADVESIEFEEEINTASRFVINFISQDFQDDSLHYLGLDTFSIGKEIKIFLGMDQTEQMVVGEITSVDPSFSVTELPKIQVSGYDRLYKVGLGKKKRTFLDKKDSEMAVQIAKDWKLTPKVEDSVTKLPYVYQNNKSDLEFLLERAKRIRYEIFVDDKTLIFREPKEKEKAVVSLEYRLDIEDFKVKLNNNTEGTTIVVKGWDVKKKEKIEGTAKSGDEAAKMGVEETGAAMSEKAFGATTSAIVDQNPVDTADAKKLAKTKYNTILNEYVTAEGSCYGITKLRAGKTVEITKLDRFSGPYYVTATTHKYNNKDGYTMPFKARRPGV